MSEKRDFTYEGCRCPHCRGSLDGVSTGCTVCPTCNKGLDARQVWMTRRYPGMLVLSGWLKAFGWPFLLILAGAGLIGFSLVSGFPIPLKLPGILLALGIVFLMYKLATNGDEP